MIRDLDEAIKHCKEIGCSDSECAKEHLQLAQWLTELKNIRELTMDNLSEASSQYQKRIEEQNPNAEAYNFDGAFLAGAMWAKNQLYKQADELITKKTNGEVTLEDTVAFNEGFRLGKEVMKSRMLEDATEEKVSIDDFDNPLVYLDYKYKEGDVIKLLVVKD